MVERPFALRSRFARDFSLTVLHREGGRVGGLSATSGVAAEVWTRSAGASSRRRARLDSANLLGRAPLQGGGEAAGDSSVEEDRALFLGESRAAGLVEQVGRPPLSVILIHASEEYRCGSSNRVARRSQANENRGDQDQEQPRRRITARRRRRTSPAGGTTERLEVAGRAGSGRTGSPKASMFVDHSVCPTAGRAQHARTRGQEMDVAAEAMPRTRYCTSSAEPRGVGNVVRPEGPATDRSCPAAREPR